MKIEIESDELNVALVALCVCVIIGFIICSIFKLSDIKEQLIVATNTLQQIHENK